MTDRRDALKSAALLPFAAWPAVSNAAPALSSACLAGHFTHDTVRLWLQGTEAARGTIAYWPASGAESEAAKVPFELRAGNEDCAVVEIAKLRPASAYRYRVTLDKGEPGPAQSFRTSAAPGTPPRAFRVYMGSCCYSEAFNPAGQPYGDEFFIFDTIAAKAAADPLPHFMLWMGDNLYLRRGNKEGISADYSSTALMDRRYRSVRAMPMLQKLYAATQHYAIWDDHDFGPDNSHREFEFKDESLKLFRAYWPNADMGSAARPGTWSTFRHEDAEFFLLDGRWQRDDEKAPATPEKAMYGPSQMAWLKEGLRKSTATFKLVAGGSQFLSENKNGVQSGWHNYPHERDDFLAFLAKEKIPGVVLLSGDRHNTVVFRFDREGAAPVYEYSSSPMTSRLTKLNEVDWANPRLVKECVVERRNFGTLEFSGAPGARQLAARAFDASGKELWQTRLAG